VIIVEKVELWKRHRKEPHKEKCREPMIYSEQEPRNNLSLQWGFTRRAVAVDVDMGGKIFSMGNVRSI
jgi:hypothetical protein